VLTRQEAVGVGTHERLDPAHALADRASERNLTSPSWPERRAWVPPHSSRAQSPTDTTRTSSPYFSPKSAIAPHRRASSWLITSA
jgi:hypothetical protein